MKIKLSSATLFNGLKWSVDVQLTNLEHHYFIHVLSYVCEIMIMLQLTHWRRKIYNTIHVIETNGN